MLSINKVKKFLKEDGIELTEEEIKVYIQTMELLARQTIDQFLKQEDI